MRFERADVSSLMERASENSTGAGATTTVVGLSCGNHATEARSARRFGSVAKLQPPLLRKPIGFAAADGPIGSLVGGIAPQKFPGECRGAKIIEIGVCGFSLPIGFVWHLSYPPLSDVSDPLACAFRLCGRPEEMLGDRWV